MTRQLIIRSQPANCHRGPAVGEIAGNAAAECAAVCCCCPCMVLNFVVLAVYTVPAGLVRKALKKKRSRLRKKVLAGDKKNDVVLLPLQRSSSMVETEILVGPTLLEYLSKESSEKSEAVALDKEMWAQFAGTGFWRSESQREP